MKPRFSWQFGIILIGMVSSCRFSDDSVREVLPSGGWKLAYQRPVPISAWVEQKPFRPDIHDPEYIPPKGDVPRFYLIGNQLFRKDQLPFVAGTDTTSWKYLGDGILKDNQYLYFNKGTSRSLLEADQIWPVKVSLSGYKTITDHLYEAEDGKLYMPQSLHSSVYMEYGKPMKKINPLPILDYCSLFRMHTQ